MESPDGKENISSGGSHFYVFKKHLLQLVCANKSSGQIEAQKSTYVRRILGKISQGKVKKFIKEREIILR